MKRAVWVGLTWSLFWAHFLSQALGQGEAPAPPGNTSAVAEMNSSAGIVDLLAPYGYDQEDWQQLTSAAPDSLAPAESWPLLLQRLNRLTSAELTGSLQAAASGQKVGAEKRAGAIYRLEGYATSVRKVTLPADYQLRFGFPHYYLVEVQPSSPAGISEAAVASEVSETGASLRPAVSDSTQTLVVGQVPAAWLATQEAERGDLHEPVRVVAVCVDVGRRLWAAQRLAWFPAQVNESLGVMREHVWLSQAGVDMAEFWQVAAAGALQHQDQPSFYSLLRAVRTGKRADAEAFVRPSWNIVAWLKTPEAERGKLYRITGVARRAIPIEVVDPQLRERLGTSKYFEVEVFVPLDQPLRLVDPAAASTAGQGRSTESGKPAEVVEPMEAWTTYPIVLCCAELPAGMPTGEDIHEPVTATGFYYKLWTYRSQESSKGGGRPARQASPLLIAWPPQRIELSADSGPSSLVITLAVGGALLGIFLIMPWYWHREDRRAAAAARRPAR